jgi:hypothetical protein
MAVPASAPVPRPVAVPALEAKLGKGPGKPGVLMFGLVMIAGVIYAASHLTFDLSAVRSTSADSRALLGNRGDHAGESIRPAMVNCRNLLLALVLTLRASTVLAGLLFWGFHTFC